MDIQLIYKMILVFLYSFFATTWVARHLLPKFKQRGFVVEDKYKAGKPKVADMGGMAIFIGILISLVLSQILIEDFEIEKLLVFYFVVIVYGAFGILDDLIDIGQKWKVFVPFIMALPIGLVISDSLTIIFGNGIDFGFFYPFIIAPIYVMVIMNLVNMHSGFNGLASGLSAIIIFFIAVRTIMEQELVLLLYLLPIMGAAWAYTRFDAFPAKMLWGNSGSFLVGSAIGAYLVMTHELVFGIVLFAPHFIDFALYMYIRITGRKWVKFGSLRKDGTIKAPDPLKLKFFFPYYFRLNEKQAVWIQYAVQLFFGVIALLIA